MIGFKGVGMFDLLKSLCEIPGPGGDEGMVQETLERRWRPRVETMYYTAVGNLVAEVGGKGPRLLILAHADEISFMVKSIDDDGYVWITTNERDIQQRPSLRSPVFWPCGQPAVILTRRGPVDGLFATLTGHILNPEQREKTKLDWSDIFVDVGATNRSEAQALGIRIGDRMVWNPALRQHGNFITGKAIDDRIGLAIMDRLLDVMDSDKLAYRLVYASTVQEEIGLIGAESILKAVPCDAVIALDIGLAGDVPGVDRRDMDIRLGKGPVVVHKDLYQYHRGLTLEILDVAAKNNIPVQEGVFSIFGSDAGAATRCGIRSALITVPTRYTHSPFETIHAGDVDETVKLLKAFVEKPMTA